jgi:hypothetical protein
LPTHGNCYNSQTNKKYSHNFRHLLWTFFFSNLLKKAPNLSKNNFKGVEMKEIQNNMYRNFMEDESHLIRYFFRLFRSKKSRLREGAIPPEELKKIIKDIGKGKKINITRLSYDGSPEDKPVSIKIVDIREDHFTGKVINVERSIKQSESKTLVYIQGGGGTIDFYYKDGDIGQVTEDIDEEIIEQRNIEEIKEILDALDLNEDVMISYYDANEGGVINGTGKLISKNMDSLDFKVTLTVINEIELNQPREIALNLNNDNILDLEVMI